MPKKFQKNNSKKLIRKPTITQRLLTRRSVLLFGASLIFFGSLLLNLQLLNIWLEQRITAAPQPIGDVLNGSKTDNHQAYISDKPAQISVPSVGIDLEIIPGHYDPRSKSWTLTLDKAQWATMTRQPNDKEGLTFIYGHNRKAVFNRLPKIRPGELAKVKTEKGYIFTYSFHASSVVPPQDTSIFNYRGKPILILQTCTGVRFENRQLFVFDLVKVE